MNKIIKYIKKFLPEIIFIPLYWFSFLIPKNKNLWVFGEWHGFRYADNSKYLFEYTYKWHKEIKSVWITKDKNIVRKVSKQNLPVFHAYSLQGIFYCLRAKLVFITHDAGDVCHYCIGRSVLVNLTHGVPLKHLGKDVIYNRFGVLTKIIDNFILPLLPLKKKYNYILCADERSKPRFESAFSAKGNVFSVGYPRWDGFNTADKLDGFDGYNSIILYAPTLRFNNHKEFKPSLYPNFDDFLKYIEYNNMLCLFRPHPTMTIDQKMLSSNNIRLVDSDTVKDINSLFVLADILLTDYSSVMYDFSMLKKTIIYFVPDLDIYLNEDVGVYGDFYLDALGPICKSWKEIIREIDKIALKVSHLSYNKKYERDFFSNYTFSFIKQIFN